MFRTLVALFIASTFCMLSNAAEKQSAAGDTKQARMVPAILPGSGGKIRGFRLDELESGSLYAKVGLKKNDIVKSVNGEKTDSPQKAMDLYNSLTKNETTKVVIERAGHDQELTLHGSSDHKM